MGRLTVKGAATVKIPDKRTASTKASGLLTSGLLSEVIDWL